MKEFLERIKCGRKREESPKGWLIKSINNALEEMCHARALFDMAVGADNVELAIYELTAAEVKYRNLLKEAKRVGLICPEPPDGEEEMENKCS